MSEGKENRKRGRRTRPLLAGYRPLPGVPDEMVDANGNAHPIWRVSLPLSKSLGRTSAQRFARADQYLRDAGVYYRVYDKSAPMSASGRFRTFRCSSTQRSGRRSAPA